MQTQTPSILDHSGRPHLIEDTVSRPSTPVSEVAVLLGIITRPATAPLPYIGTLAYSGCQVSFWNSPSSGIRLTASASSRTAAGGGVRPVDVRTARGDAAPSSPV